MPVIYDVGDVAAPSAAFGGVQTAVTAQIRKPDGTIASFAGGQVVYDGLGVYHVALSTTLVGVYEWEFTGDSNVIQGAFEVSDLLINLPPDRLQPRALCTLLDVTKRVPGYQAGDDGETDDTLSDLILRESRDFGEVTGREIVAMGTSARVFDLTAVNLRVRSVRVGDAAAITQVELFDYDEATSLGVISPSLYVLEPRVRDDWQPIRRIRFPYRPGAAILLAPGRTLTVTATWGFPAIPQTVKTAVASLVIWRYINDVAAEGTAFADAVNRADFNFAQALRVALDVRDRLRNPPFA